MMNRMGKALGMVAGLAMTALGGSAMAADLIIDLDGAGSSTGAPLSASISIDVTSAKTATLHITNTSPASAAWLNDAPVLTRIGFNLAGGPSASCLSVASPSWSLDGKVEPYCGVGGTKTCSKGKKKKGKWWSKGGKGSEKSFAYELQAANPAPKHGVARGESLDLQLVVKPCCKAFALTADSFLDAGVSPSGGELVQWAAKFQVVGPKGQDSGCARGDVDLPPPPPVTCQPTYTWSEFIATAAESVAMPSDVAIFDTRAGSVEYNFNGGYGFDGIFTDRAFDAAILTLRNGLSAVLDQTQFNRRWADAVGCQPGSSFVRCWIFAPLDLVDEVLSAAVPTWAASSNAGHDSSGQRVEISGELLIDYSEADAHGDNAHETMTVTWTAPKGLATAQLLLRGRYDWNLDGLNGSDPMVPLFRRNVAGYADMQDTGVVILSETPTTLTIALNAQAGLVRVCQDYATAGYVTVDGSQAGGYATVGGGLSGYATVN